MKIRQYGYKQQKMWYCSRNATSKVKSQVSYASDYKISNTNGIHMFWVSLGWHKFSFASEFSFSDSLVYVSNIFLLELNTFFTSFSKPLCTSLACKVSAVKGQI